ncbi:ISKra4 family transposase [Streptomyces sp. NPDC056231]|uniref:ISKra4 family transposase n=1 Tax=Streptomyces sp. NPDC056231 TaxID=3345755 RepID=UPI003AAC1883
MNAGRGGDESDSAAGLEQVIRSFAASWNLFGALVEDLHDESADRLTHAQLEGLIASRGREVMRRLLQDHLDLRFTCEPRLTRVTGTDQVTRRRIEPGHERLLATVFGTVTVARTAYRALGASNLHPMDAVLNLPAERSSHGLRQLAALEAVRGSFDDAQRAIERGCGTRIGKRQIEQLTVRAAVDVEAFYRARAPEPCTADTLLVLSVDGKGVVMRPEALTDATRKAAEAKGGNKMRTRLSGGEKNGRKRMAMLGAVYDVGPAPRAVDDVITPPPDPDSDGPAGRNRGPEAFNKWLTGSVTDNTQSVISAVFDQAEQRDPIHARTWIVLVDGAKAQIDQIHTEAELRGVSVHIVVDFVHVLEYLWKAAWCFHAANDPAAESWVAAQARSVLAGDSEQVIADIRTAAKTAVLGEDKLKTIEAVCGYLESKSPYLRYDTALTRGWPIATGIIEGACRHLVKDRLDITGARWSLAGAEAVLKLRALISNGDFDPYYAWHLKQEHRRVHQARYQDRLRLAAPRASAHSRTQHQAA